MMSFEFNSICLVFQLGCLFYVERECTTAMGEIERGMYDGLLIGGLVVAGIVFVTLLWIVAPYGRHVRRGWGPEISARVGWIVMETVSPVVFLGCFLLGRPELSPALGVLVFLWVGHYGYRAFVFPFRMRAAGKTMPVVIVGMAVVFNSLNGYLNGRYLGVMDEQYGAGWPGDPRFIVGVVIFFVGFGIHFHSDGILFRLRGPGETGYKIPRGGGYRWLSCPNYLGEIVEWIGWAIATWSFAGLYFALWTAANLVPRARSHHRWYRETFEDYPEERRAVMPGLF